MTPEDMLIELEHWLASGAPVILRLHRLVRTAAEPEVITHRPHEPLGDGDLTPEQLEGMDMWDRDVMLAERHRAIGALLVHRAVTDRRVAHRGDRGRAAAHHRRQSRSGVHHISQQDHDVGRARRAA